MPTRTAQPPKATPAQLARKVMDMLPHMMHAINAPMRELRDGGASDAGNPGNMMQMYTMMALHAGPRAFKDLVAHRRVSAPTLSRSIEALVKRGWVARVPHPDDKRQILLKLTEAGQQEFEGVRQRRQDHLTKLLAGLSVEERAAAFEGIDALQKAFDMAMKQAPKRNC
jgi:DNA-binding MarR family transcriptional regulator